MEKEIKEERFFDDPNLVEYRNEDQIDYITERAMKAKEGQGMQTAHIKSVNAGIHIQRIVTAMFVVKDVQKKEYQN